MIFLKTMIEADLLAGFSKIYNVYADNQQIMQKWCKLIAETVSRNKVKENVSEIWFIHSKQRCVFRRASFCCILQQVCSIL